MLQSEMTSLQFRIYKLTRINEMNVRTFAEQLEQQNFWRAVVSTQEASRRLMEAISMKFKVSSISLAYEGHTLENAIFPHNISGKQPGKEKPPWFANKVFFFIFKSSDYQLLWIWIFN